MSNTQNAELEAERETEGFWDSVLQPFIEPWQQVRRYYEPSMHDQCEAKGRASTVSPAIDLALRRNAEVDQGAGR